jgi:hypothetical protein
VSQSEGGFASIEALFAELDSRHFAGRLIRAGFRIDQRNLGKPGAVEFYTRSDGSMGSYRIGDDGILGAMIFAARLILIDHHDPERLAEVGVKSGE